MAKDFLTSTYYLCGSCRRAYPPAAAEQANFKCENCQLYLFDDDGDQYQVPENILPSIY